MKRRNLKATAMITAKTTVSPIFKILVAIAGLLFIPAALAQNATLLPNAVQQFFDNNGNPLSSGTVTFYIPNTQTKKTVYKDAAKTTPWSNPITLNAAGRPPNDAGIYGVGNYTQLVKDRNNNTIWNQPTSATGSGSDPTAVGDGNIVGTILPWAGLTAPAQYVFAYGQEISRTTYSTYYDTVTIQQSINCTSGSAVVSGLSDTTQIPLGAPIEATCLVPGATVAAKTTTTITASSNAILTATSTARFFPFGNGNGSSTLNVPDLRGYALVGRPNMGGTATTVLNTDGFAFPGQGSTGGSQSRAIAESNIPAYNLSGAGLTVVPTVVTGVTLNKQTFNVGGGATQLVLQDNTSLTVNTNSSAAITGNIPSGGGGVAFNILQPSRSMNYIVKIAPDASASDATGVASLGGMTGVLTCGTGILCVSQDVSINTAIFVPSAFVGGGATTVPNGGTGVTTIPNNELMYGQGTSSIATLPNPATAGYVLINNVGSAPSWSQTPLLSELHYVNAASVATPPSGQTWTFVSSSQKVLNVKDDTGATSLTVKPITCAADNFVVSLSSGGVLACSPGTIGSTVTVPQGGTGVTSLAAGAILYGAGTSPMVAAAPVTDGVLSVAGTCPGSCNPVFLTTISNTVQNNITRTGTLVAGSTGAGFTIALGASTVTGDLAFSNLTQIAGTSVLGVAAGSTADVAAITASADGQFLRRSGGSLSFGNPQFAYTFSTGSTSVASGATRYFGLGTDQSAAEVASYQAPRSGTLRSLYVTATGSPGAGETFVYTVMVAGVATSMTCTISNPNRACSDTSNTAAYTAGQYIDIRIVNSAAGATRTHTAAIGSE